MLAVRRSDLAGIAALGRHLGGQLQRLGLGIVDIGRRPEHVRKALVQLLRWRVAGQPGSWPVSDDPEVKARVKRYLDEAGIAPGHPAQVAKSSSPGGGS